MAYKKAPIREALFDIRITQPLSIEESEFSDFIEGAKEEFPKHKKIYKFQSQVNLPTEENSEPAFTDTANSFEGMRFMVDDETRILQVTKEGFTLNVLSPYISWEEHFPVFLKYWQLYESCFKPIGIQRIGARYINRIELPFPLKNFSEYITMAPPIPASLPKIFLKYFMQIQVPCGSDVTQQCILTQTMDSVENDKVPMIIDIDAVHLKAINGIDDLKQSFDALRQIKNTVFEELITDNLRQTFA